MSDRPPHRAAIKAAFRLLGGARAHWQEGWPGLALDRPEGDRPGVARYRGKPLCPLLPVAALGERTGGTITIVGSGPSIAGIDAARLPGLPILLNGATSLHPSLPERVVAVEDERFVWRHLAMLREALRPDTLRLFSPAVIRAIAEQDTQLLSDAPVILVENLLKPFRRRRRTLDRVPVPVAQSGDAAVSLAPQQGVVIAGTVAFSAFQFALAAGPRRVALAGVDLSGADKPRFYETAEARARSGLDAGRERILAHFALAIAEARARGVEVVTVTPGSALETVGARFAPL